MKNLIINYNNNQRQINGDDMKNQRLLQKVLVSVILVALTGLIPELLNAMQESNRNVVGEVHVMTLSQLQKKFYKTEVEEEISVEFENETLEEALAHIARETGLKLTYRGDFMVDKKVSLQSKTISVSDALAYVLEDTGLDYKFSRDGYLLIAGVDEINENNIYQNTVEGRVTDITTGEPLQGVNIVVEGTTIGSATDANGEYEIEIENLQATLVFTYIGYSTRVVPINGRTEINIELQSEAVLGEDLIVVGYGTQRKIDVTSSISSISGEDFADQPVQHLGEALQGRIPGAQFVQSSGSPGAPMNVRIRGIGTVNESDPLFVVDGNAGVDPLDLNPNQIESIQVLKSSSAAAIYGARGANGVVLITTKRGRSGTSSVDVNYSYGIQEVHNRLDLANGKQYATIYNRALINGGNVPLFDNVESLGEGTDWQDAVLRTAPIQNLDLSVSGGSDQGTYYISGGYFQQDGTVIESDYSRLNFRVNSQYDINSFITAGENISINQSDRTYVLGEYGSRDILAQAVRMDPTAPVKNPDGSYGFAKEADSQNPVAQANFHDNEISRTVLNGSFYMDIMPLNNLVYHSQVNINLAQSDDSHFHESYFVNPLQRNFIPTLEIQNNKTIYWDWENTLTFDTNFESHDLEVIGGVTVLEQRSERLTAAGQNLPENSNNNLSLRYLDLAPDGQVVGGSAGEFGLLSYLGRINYNYNGTYLFTGNMRVDGSSKFGSENRYGYFPSFSAGWRISNENFMRDISFIDELKIRGGWGKLGNQTTLPNYAFTSSLAQNQVYYFGQTTHQGQAPSTISNPNLKWESTSETDFGIDFTGFDNRVTLEASYYYKKTTDMLLRIPILNVAGISQDPFVNGGDVLNKGVEFMLGYRKTTVGDFYYNVSVNFSRNINEVTKLSEERASISSGPTRTEVGGPIGAFFGYVADGIFQSQQEVENHAFQANGTAPGDIKFKDINGDGVINQEDRDIIGNPWPEFKYGVNTDFTWKQFDLSIALQGVYGNDVYQSYKSFTQGSQFSNFGSEMLEVLDGISTKLPRLNTNNPNDNLRTSSYLVSDASYLRLQNLRLGYTFPSGSILNGIRDLKIYFSGRNLLTFTEYDGYDPEVGVVPGNPLNMGIDSIRYPQPRIFTFGMRLGI